MKLPSHWFLYPAPQYQPCPPWKRTEFNETLNKLRDLRSDLKSRLAYLASREVSGQVKGAVKQAGRAEDEAMHFFRRDCARTFKALNRGLRIVRGAGTKMTEAEREAW